MAFAMSAIGNMSCFAAGHCKEMRYPMDAMINSFRFRAII
jgi:hypothetical protein